MYGVASTIETFVYNDGVGGVDQYINYVGGSNNVDGGSKWAPAIHMWKDQYYYTVWELKIDGIHENNEADHTFIDHMSVDSHQVSPVGSSLYMRGTMRSRDVTNPHGGLHLWRLVRECDNTADTNTVW